jgi:hypothetical protein
VDGGDSASRLDKLPFDVVDASEVAVGQLVEGLGAELLDGLSEYEGRGRCERRRTSSEFLILQPIHLSVMITSTDLPSSMKSS